MVVFAKEIASKQIITINRQREAFKSGDTLPAKKEFQALVGDWTDALGPQKFTEVLDIVDHPNKRKYPNQRVFILEINEYVYYVPFVEDENEVFLKTIIPSRKLKKDYLGGKNK